MCYDEEREVNVYRKYPITKVTIKKYFISRVQWNLFTISYTMTTSGRELRGRCLNVRRGERRGGGGVGYNIFDLKIVRYSK